MSDMSNCKQRSTICATTRSLGKPAHGAPTYRFGRSLGANKRFGGFAKNWRFRDVQPAIDRTWDSGRRRWLSRWRDRSSFSMGGVQMKWDATLWAGRKFRDNATGETLVIPDDVRPKQFFSWGESFIDVGDGVYSRCGGDFIELTEPVIVEDIDAEHCPACGAVMQDSEIALCLCSQCGTRVCEGLV